jgi:hypothetical protein
MNKKNKSGGFIKFIILIIIVIFLMSYFNITIGEAIDWIVVTVKNIF